MLIDFARYRAAALLLEARGTPRPAPAGRPAAAWWRAELHKAARIAAA
jgi:hypothetical protein